jgi:citrate lyase subunit beta/citryl-CoA lyase
MARRSWLFVPGDSERKLGKVMQAGADVVIVDLEDAVAPEAKTTAREMTREWLGDAVEVGAERWMRINPLDTPLWRADLEAVLPGKPAGIMVPKAAGPGQLQALEAALDELEPRHAIAPGATRILPLVSETAAAALGIAAYAEARGERLLGLTWGAEDLSAAIGATRKRDGHGRWTDLFRMVRSTVLLAAHARSIAAIDTLYAEFRDISGLERVASEAYADGFEGMLAIHPSQVPVINAAFTPSEAELAGARAIIDAFDREPGAGAVQLDGRMIDQPHLHQARRLLERSR